MLRSCSLALLLVAFLSPAHAADRKPTDRKRPDRKPVEKKPADGPSATSLALEVEALQTLRRFGMTTTQLEALRKLAGDTASRDKREPGKASAAYRKTLLDLRDALVKEDEERITSLEEKLQELDDKDEADLDDDVDITPVARKSTAEVLSSLTARQVGAFLTAYPYELPSLLERLTDTLDITGKLKDDDWKLVVEDIVGDLSWQLAGVDADRSRLAGKRVEQFLAAVRAGKASRAELEKEARQLVGQVPPTLVLHNVVEHTLAELLSNPRLAAAIDARLKK
jgi:hypothetical protein